MRAEEELGLGFERDFIGGLRAGAHRMGWDGMFIVGGRKSWQAAPLLCGTRRRKRSVSCGLVDGGNLWSRVDGIVVEDFRTEGAKGKGNWNGNGEMAVLRYTFLSVFVRHDRWNAVFIILSLLEIGRGSGEYVLVLLVHGMVCLWFCCVC